MEAMVIWYNVIMEKTEVDELLEAALAQQKKWRKPSNEPKLTHRQWQEILDDAPSPHLRVGNL